MDPFQLMDGLITDMARSIGGGDTGELLPIPRVNVEDGDDKIRITAELPGVSEDDIQITVDDDLLVISGEKRDEHEEEQGDMRVIERVFGRFRRAIQLPFRPDPDQVDAVFRDGVLTITVPKNAEQRNRTRQILVRRDDGSSSRSSERAIGSGAQSGTAAGGSTGSSTTGASGSSQSGTAHRRREKAEAPAG
jgi:HSP20 family protein